MVREEEERPVCSAETHRLKRGFYREKNRGVKKNPKPCVLYLDRGKRGEPRSHGNNQAHWEKTDWGHYNAIGRPREVDLNLLDKGAGYDLG